MKIIGVKIENYKRIEFVDIFLDENMNIVSGRNGAGKSSLIEAMMDALGGKTEMGKIPQRKIKTGADKAIIEIDILDDEGRTLSIKRTITAKDVYLKAEVDSGEVLKQTDLDTIFDRTTINLMKLLGLSKAEQIDFMKDVGGIDTSGVEAKYKDKFAERKVLNKQLKDAKSVLASIGDVEPATRVDQSAVLKQIEEATEQNKLVDAQQKEVSDLEDDIAKEEQEVVNKKQEISDKLHEIDRLQTELAQDEASIVAGKALAEEKFVNIEKRVSTEELSAKLKDSESINKDAAEYDRYTVAVEDHDKVHDKVSAINDDMRGLMADRERIIKESSLPFDNVSFDKELGVLIDGIPFDDMSTAQQIRMMSRIYIESNPALKVIYIKDGSLLDPQTLKEISEMSELKDYQFLVELVSEVEDSIIMREGRVLGSEKEEKELAGETL